MFYLIFCKNFFYTWKELSLPHNQYDIFDRKWKILQNEFDSFWIDMNVNQFGKSGSLSWTTVLKLSQPSLYLYKLVLANKNSFLNQLHTVYFTSMVVYTKYCFCMFTCLYSVCVFLICGIHCHLWCTCHPLAVEVHHESPKAPLLCTDSIYFQCK